MCLFTLFLKSEKGSSFVFANTCYQKDINLPDKNKTGKGNLAGSQDIHGLFDSTDCTVKINVSKQVLTYRIYHYRNGWRCMPREAKNKVQLTASACTATALAHTECHCSRRRWHSMATSCQILKAGKAASSFATMALVPYLHFSPFPRGNNSGSLLGRVLQLPICVFSFYF